LAPWGRSRAGPGPPLIVVGGEVAVSRDPDTEGGALEIEDGKEGGEPGNGYTEHPAEATVEPGAAWSFASDGVAEDLRRPPELDAGAAGMIAGLTVAASDIWNSTAYGGKNGC
jgi:hypothetical protein